MRGPLNVWKKSLLVKKEEYTTGLQSNCIAQLTMDHGLINWKSYQQSPHFVFILTKVLISFYSPTNLSLHYSECDIMCILAIIFNPLQHIFSIHDMKLATT